MYNFTTGPFIFLNFEDKVRDFLDNFKGTFPTQLEFLGQSPGFSGGGRVVRGVVGWCDGAG